MAMYLARKKRTGQHGDDAPPITRFSAPRLAPRHTRAKYAPILARAMTPHGLELRGSDDGTQSRCATAMEQSPGEVCPRHRVATSRSRWEWGESNHYGPIRHNRTHRRQDHYTKRTKFNTGKSLRHRKLGRRDVKKLLAEKGAGAKQAAKKKARTKVKKKVVGRGTRKRATKKQK